MKLWIKVLQSYKDLTTPGFVCCFPPSELSKTDSLLWRDHCLTGKSQTNTEELKDVLCLKCLFLNLQSSPLLCCSLDLCLLDIVIDRLLKVRHDVYVCR